jgi:hypothetical protein
MQESILVFHFVETKIENNYTKKNFFFTTGFENGILQNIHLSEYISDSV